MRGLYLITNDDPIEKLLEKLEIALSTGHIAILQYRRKKVSSFTQPKEIHRIKDLCTLYKVPLVINDDLMLAQQFGLGVHLGQADGEISEAKLKLGPNAIIGRTCANSLMLAEQAIMDGATYVAFGAIYATSTKPEAGTIGLEVLKQANSTLSTPLCAIGGLTVENSEIIIQSGADLCAVISDVLDRPLNDIAHRVKEWAALFAKNSSLS